MDKLTKEFQRIHEALYEGLRKLYKCGGTHQYGHDRIDNRIPEIYDCINKFEKIKDGDNSTAIAYMYRIAEGLEGEVYDAYSYRGWPTYDLLNAATRLSESINRCNKIPQYTTVSEPIEDVENPEAQNARLNAYLAGKKEEEDDDDEEDDNEEEAWWR